MAVSVAFMVGAGPATAERLAFDPAVVYRVPVDDAPYLGPKDAPITIVEFSDFYCPHCRRLTNVLQEVVRLYPGMVRLVYRHSLLDPEDGTLAAVASMAAHQQGKFWPFHDRLFSVDERITRGLVERVAVELELDMVRFRRDLDSERQLGAVRSDETLAAGLGVTSLPIVFINGRPISGAYPLGTFIAVLEEEFERASRLLERGIESSKLYAALVAKGKTRGTSLEPGGDESFVPSIDEAKIYPVGLGIKTHRRGPTDAPVTLVEFSDFRCGYCAKAHTTVEKLADIYGDDLRIVYRHIPQLGEDDSGRMISEAAVEAGEQGKFWSFHDRLFTARSRVNRAALERIAVDVGLDMAQFRAALDDRRHQSAVVRDIGAARALGVQGTPTFYINGRPLVGSQPIDAFKVAIDAAKVEAEALIASGVTAGKVYEESIRRKLAEATAASTADAKPAEKVDIDPVDYHIAVLMACRSGDGQQAAALFESVKNRQRRRLIRKDCKRLGIDLPR